MDNDILKSKAWRREMRTMGLYRPGRVFQKGYESRGVDQQIVQLRKLFPGLGTADVEIAKRELPQGAEGWFAIPRWEKIGHTYNEAVGKVLSLIWKSLSGEFYNYCEGYLDPDRLRQHEHTVAMLKKLGNQQAEHDILIVPAQFGLRHRYRSVLSARETFSASEFGLGAFAVGVMALTHPERLKDDLWIGCAGDEYDGYRCNGQFLLAPYFDYDYIELEVRFIPHPLSREKYDYSQASGFVPQ